jgi:hypothetical protein
VSCEKFRSDLTSYLEGDLADDRGSAVRGHLRGCQDCRRAAADEAALRDGLRALPPLDPPASLWAGVQQRLAAEEVADAERSTWRRVLARWMPKAPQLAFGGAVLAAAIVLIVVRSQQSDEGARTVSAPVKIDPVVLAPSTHIEPAPAPVTDDDRDVSEALVSAPSRVNDEYAAAAGELLPLAREARARWSEAQQREFDARLAELDQAIASAGDDRAKQRGYRALIRYLQRAAIRDDVALASTGGAP